MQEILRVEELTKKHAHFRALKGVDLTVAPGEIIGLVGENGAGKSTLISLLSGVNRPDSGRMYLEGEPYHPGSVHAARASGVSVVLQRFTVAEDLTVAESIAGLAHPVQGGREQLLARAREALTATGSHIDPEAPVGSLMRAEQAFVEVLRVQLEDPRLVLMDEVAATFNDQEVALVHEITRQLAQQGRGVIYITHRIDEVRSLADRVVVMREGAVKEEFSPREAGAGEIVYSMLERELPERPRPGNSSDAAGEAIRVEGLSTDTGLEDVDLTLRRGEILGLTGMRRAGMNELAAALVGVRPSTARTLRVMGEDVTVSSPEDAVRLGIGYLSDNDDETGVMHEESLARMLLQDELHPDATFVHEVSALRDVVAQVKSLRINTQDIRSQVGKLSGGDQQKIALARWMSTDCDVLILNHPTRGIDVGAKGDIYEMLTALTRKGTSVLLISSEMTELLQWCHRILVMRDGHVVSEQDNDEATEDTLMTAALGHDVISDEQREVFQRDARADVDAAQAPTRRSLRREAAARRG